MEKKQPLEPLAGVSVFRYGGPELFFNPQGPTIHEIANGLERLYAQVNPTLQASDTGQRYPDFFSWPQPILFVAVKDGECIGMATLNGDFNRGLLSGFVTDVFVDALVRRRRVGTRIMEAVVACAVKVLAMRSSLRLTVNPYVLDGDGHNAFFRELRFIESSRAVDRETSPDATNLRRLSITDRRNHHCVYPAIEQMIKRVSKVDPQILY